MKKIHFLLLFLTSFLYAQNQITRTEPPFWYAEMKNPELQIIFYGKNIAENDVTVSKTVLITDIKRTENPNYLFVTVNTQGAKPQDLVFAFYKDNKFRFNKHYTLKPRRADSENRKGFDASDVVYLVMSDRFANGDTSNDTEKSVFEKVNRTNPNGRHGGDIAGMIKNLDYIKSLGATALWPTPLCEDNEKEYSYHTYAQSDVYKIDPRFGTNDEYVNLSKELHKRNMKLIKDYVVNHWGAAHWMMNDLPTYEWIHQFPGYGQTNYKMTTQFDTNASKIDSNLCMDGWFVKSMPDLNQSNPLVLKYLIQNAIWWIEYADLDGFRVDTYSYCDKKGIAEWTKAIMDEYPNFNIVGEIWMYNQAHMAYWQKDSKIAAIQNYNSNLPSVMDFTLQDAIGTAFNENETKWNSGLSKIYDNFTNDFLYPNPNSILVFAENHDTNRLNEIYKNDIKKYRMVMALIATVRGIPQLYYGSEIGMAGNKDKGDADIRQDFPGGWSSDGNNAFIPAKRTSIQATYFDFTSQLFNWRKTNEAVQFGKMTHYVPEDNIYVYFRYTDKKTVMVILNNNSDLKAVKTDRFAESIKNFKKGKDIITGKIFILKEEIILPKNDFCILELE